MGGLRKRRRLTTQFRQQLAVSGLLSAIAIGELVKQTFADLGGAVEFGEMSVREEARGLLLPTAIFARWFRS